MAINAEYDAGGALETLSAVGVEFDRSGNLSFNSARFDEVAADNLEDLQSLFAGDGVDEGVFAELETLVAGYVDAGGLLSEMQERLTDRAAALTTRISDFEARLATKRAALQKEYIAADLTMTRLNSQMGQLQSLGGQFRLF